MSLISRYILREAVGSTVVVVLVLLVVLMSNQFAEILGDAAAATLPKEAVARVFGLTFLRYLTIVAPIGLLLGLLLALARLNRDSEMVAIAACGIGPAKLLRPIGLFALLVAGLISWLVLFRVPAADREVEEIKFEAQDELEFATVEPGSFTSPDSGQTILYVRDVVDGLWRGVFLYREQEDAVSVVVADAGERVLDQATGELTFLLYNGRRYEGVPGRMDWVIFEFEEHGIPISFQRKDEFVEVVATRTTPALLASTAPEDRAELQWRISSPLSLLILALLAIPLSRSSPREGRYARVGAGLLVYMVYANTLSIARLWVERSRVPEWLGMWWVHALLGTLAVAMLLRDSGVFVRTPNVAAPLRDRRREPIA